MATLKFPRAGISQSLTSVLCLLLAFSVLVPPGSYALPNANVSTQSEAYQAADILGIRPQVDRLLLLQRDGAGAAPKTEMPPSIASAFDAVSRISHINSLLPWLVV